MFNIYGDPYILNNTCRGAFMYVPVPAVQTLPGVFSMVPPGSDWFYPTLSADGKRLFFGYPSVFIAVISTCKMWLGTVFNDTNNKEWAVFYRFFGVDDDKAPPVDLRLGGPNVNFAVAFETASPNDFPGATLAQQFANFVSIYSQIPLPYLSNVTGLSRVGTVFSKHQPGPEYTYVNAKNFTLRKVHWVSDQNPADLWMPGPANIISPSNTDLLNFTSWPFLSVEINPDSANASVWVDQPFGSGGAQTCTTDLPPVTRQLTFSSNPPLWDYNSGVYGGIAYTESPTLAPTLAPTTKAPTNPGDTTNPTTSSPTVYPTTAVPSLQPSSSAPTTSTPTSVPSLSLAASCDGYLGIGVNGSYNIGFSVNGSLIVRSVQCFFIPRLDNSSITEAWTAVASCDLPYFSMPELNVLADRMTRVRIITPGIDNGTFIESITTDAVSRLQSNYSSYRTLSFPSASFKLLYVSSARIKGMGYSTSCAEATVLAGSPFPQFWSCGNTGYAHMIPNLCAWAYNVRNPADKPMYTLLAQGRFFVNPTSSPTTVPTLAPTYDPSILCGPGQFAVPSGGSLLNGDFEAQNTSTYYYSTPFNWTSPASATAIIRSGNSAWGYVSSFSGSYFINLQSRGTAISQRIAVPLISSLAYYTISFASLSRAYQSWHSNLTVSINNQLVANLAPLWYSEYGNHWKTYQINVTSVASFGSTVLLTFNNSGGYGSGATPNAWNVFLDAVTVKFCSFCPLNTYSVDGYGSSCLPCPNGYGSPVGSSTCSNVLTPSPTGAPVPTALTFKPTVLPSSVAPSSSPMTRSPTTVGYTYSPTTLFPSQTPSKLPSTQSPTSQPSLWPTTFSPTTDYPTSEPTPEPSFPTPAPTTAPTVPTESPNFLDVQIPPSYEYLPDQITTPPTSEPINNITPTALNISSLATNSADNSGAAATSASSLSSASIAVIGASLAVAIVLAAIFVALVLKFKKSETKVEAQPDLVLTPWLSNPLVELAPVIVPEPNELVSNSTCETNSPRDFSESPRSITAFLPRADTKGGFKLQELEVEDQACVARSPSPRDSAQAWASGASTLPALVSV